MTRTAADDAASDQHAAALTQARRFMGEGDHARALDLAQTILAQSPEQTDALYVGAVAARYADRPDEARALLARLIAAAPEYGRAWQEKAHLARDTGDAAGAITAYRRATQLNPALEASWTMLAKLLADSGAQAEARAAHAQAERLAALPRPLVAVTNFIHEGKILKAEALCRKFLLAQPRHVEAIRLLADIGSRLGSFEDAEFLLKSAIEFEPENIQLRLDMIQLLRKRQKFAAARDQAQWLVAREPDNMLFQSHLAIERMQTGDYDGALALFQTVLDTLPDDPATLTSRGHALKTLGREDEAIAAYQAAIAARPDQGEAYYALANLKTYRFTDAQIAAMEAQAARDDIGLMDRVHLSFALGKAFEDRKDHAGAFEHYARGNALKRAQTRYDAELMHSEIVAQIESCTAGLFEAKAGQGHGAPDPIFILGLPRAGSTLLEQILASHSQIDGTLELPDILALAHRLRGRDKSRKGSAYPAILHDLTAAQLEEMGAAYIENTRIHRQRAPFFIDKMPNNFRHIGLIHLILPNAKIIDARRAPMDCCFSCFKQLFAEGQEFTYGLNEIGRYYRDYGALMAHWDAVLPEGRVLRVRHEAVLDDLEGQVRRMLGYLGLPFEQACLDFHKTDRAVRTASAQQVRRPINRSGVGAWKPFEPWLDELKALLEPE